MTFKAAIIKHLETFVSSEEAAAVFEKIEPKETMRGRWEKETDSEISSFLKMQAMAAELSLFKWLLENSPEHPALKRLKKMHKVEVEAPYGN